MSGLSRHTLAPLGAEQHLAQSIGDILGTPIGSRVMRRDYGSDLPRILDQPINGETLVDLYQATAEALDTWEPRFRLQRVQVEDATAGTLHLVLTGEIAELAGEHSLRVEVST